MQNNGLMSPTVRDAQAILFAMSDEKDLRWSVVSGSQAKDFLPACRDHHPVLRP